MLRCRWSHLLLLRADPCLDQVFVVEKTAVVEAGSNSFSCGFALCWHLVSSCKVAGDDDACCSCWKFAGFLRTVSSLLQVTSKHQTPILLILWIQLRFWALMLFNNSPRQLLQNQLALALFLQTLEKYDDLIAFHCSFLGNQKFWDASIILPAFLYACDTLEFGSFYAAADGSDYSLMRLASIGGASLLMEPLVAAECWRLLGSGFCTYFSSWCSLLAGAKPWCSGATAGQQQPCGDI